MTDHEWIAEIRKLAEEDIEAAVGEVVGLSNYAENYKLVEAFLIEMTRCDEPNLRGISVLGLGHLARIHRESSKEAVCCVRHALQDADPYVSGHADSAADDIVHFTEFNVRNGL